jgi:sugar phosphate isomerase/epimerase
MVFWGREHSLSLEQECQFLRSLGFGIELLPHIKGQSECRYERRNWPRLVTATGGMLVSMCSRNDRPTLVQWCEQIECARQLNAHIVADLRSLDIRGDHDLSGLAAEVINLAELNEVKLCLETGPLPILKRVSECFESLWYCLDTGYANLDPQFSFKEYIDELAPRVAHLHLTDNYGQMDDQCRLVCIEVYHVRIGTTC